jgi:hypothetical protein
MPINFSILFFVPISDPIAQRTAMIADTVSNLKQLGTPTHFCGINTRMTDGEEQLRQKLEKNLR